MTDAIKLRREIHNLKSINDFYAFSEKYKDIRKTYAFCFYAFMEKLLLSNKNEANDFFITCKHNIQLSQRVKQILENMLKGA